MYLATRVQVAIDAALMAQRGNWPKVTQCIER